MMAYCPLMAESRHAQRLKLHQSYDGFRAESSHWSDVNFIGVDGCTRPVANL